MAGVSGLSMWRPSIQVRIALGAVGLVVVFVGWVAWDLETEYGGNGVCGSELSGGVTRVFDCPGEQADAEGHPITTIVFEGTEAEAREFMDQRWNEGRNYTIPAVIIGVGVLLLLGAFVPAFKPNSSQHSNSK